MVCYINKVKFTNDTSCVWERGREKMVRVLRLADLYVSD